MKTTMMMLVLAGLLIGCREKREAVMDAAAGAPAGGELMPAVMEPEAIPTPQAATVQDEDDEVRRVRRRNAVADLLAAHQKISQDEDFAKQYRDMIREMKDPAELALTMNDLQEIQADIREVKSSLPGLERAAEDLSRPGDPSYRIELIKFQSDLIKAKHTASKADKADAPAAKEKVERMHSATLDEVLGGTFSQAD